MTKLGVVQELIKYGVIDVGVIMPENPALQTQPEETDAPVLLAGHMTGAQLPVKYGDDEDGNMLPDSRNPARQVHVEGTLSPTLFAGHGTGKQVLV